MEDMDIDSTKSGDNPDTFEQTTAEFMTAIMDTKSLKEKLEYLTKRKQVRDRLSKNLRNLKQTNEKNMQTEVKQLEKSKNEYEKEAAEVEKLKVLLANLEAKVAKFRSDPPSDPMIKREHDVQEYMKLRYERENPEDSVLKEEISILSDKVAHLQAELSAVNDMIDDTKVEIAKFQVPATLVRSSDSDFAPTPCTSSPLDLLPGTTGNYATRSKTLFRVHLKGRRNY